jgi:hypothetical protein
MRTLIVTSLVLPLLLCAAQAHAQQPPRVTEHGELHRTPGNTSLEVNAPRPLQEAVLALNEEYGWTVGYEDPQWQSGGPDLVDDTDPTWRASHPNERGVTRLRGGVFKSQYPELPATPYLRVRRPTIGLGRVFVTERNPRSGLIFGAMREALGAGKGRRAASGIEFRSVTEAVLATSALRSPGRLSVWR